jgi:hypothetical protein
MARFTHGPPLLSVPLAAADILLWKDRNLSAGLLAGATLVWYLFEVVEYSIVPLVCQIAILAMLVVFIWSNAAPLLNMYETSLLHERKKITGCCLKQARSFIILLSKPGLYFDTTHQQHYLKTGLSNPF